METIYEYFVLVDGKKYMISANLFTRFRSWALETKKEFSVHSLSFFDKGSYSEEAIDSNGGYEKETKVQHTLEFTETFLGSLLQSMTFFNWERE